MITEEQQQKICNDIQKIIQDAKMSYLEVFGVLETIKVYYGAQLIDRNIKTEIVGVNLNRVKELVKESTGPGA